MSSDVTTFPADNIETLWRYAWDMEYDSTRMNARVDPSEWRTAGRATKDKPNKEDLEFWKAEGLRHVENYVKWLDANPNLIIYTFPTDGSLAVEWGATFQFGGVPVKGYVDAVYVDTRTGELLIVDYKTGSRKPESSQQLGLYACMVEQAHGIRPQLGGFYMTRKGELSAPDVLDQWTPGFFDRLFADVDTAIKHQLFPPSMSMCGGCGMARFCAAVDGEEAGKYDPYLGGGTIMDTAPHRSYSQVTSYLKCPKQFYLSRIAQAPEVPAVYLVAGKAIHYAFEQINRSRFTD